MKKINIKTVIGVMVLFISQSLLAHSIERTELLHVPQLENEVVLNNGFKPHSGFKGSGYFLEPLHRVHGISDYKAWHDDNNTFKELKTLYAAAWNGWPRAHMTAMDNTKDLERIHYNEFLGRTENNYSAYSYTVLNASGTDVIGSLYIYPSYCNSKAMVFFWLMSSYRPYIEANFYNETKTWIESQFPYGADIMYPGIDVTDEQRGKLYVEMENKICRQK